MNIRLATCFLSLLVVTVATNGQADDTPSSRPQWHPELIEVRSLTGLRWDRSAMVPIFGDRHPKVVAIDRRIERVEALPEQRRPKQNRPFMEMTVEELQVLQSLVNARLNELKGESSEAVK